MRELQDIFTIATPRDFNLKAIQTFNFQYSRNKVYRQFCDLLRCHPGSVDRVEKIPFLPIDFFKNKEVVSSKTKAEAIFTSSGTTGTKPSKHFVTDLALYEESFLRGFTHFYNSVENYAVLALLPSYLEREGSSLIYMVKDLIEKSNNSASGFYLHDMDALVQNLKNLEEKGE